VIKKPNQRRIVDLHFCPFESHQRRGPCSGYWIAEGIEDTEIGQELYDFPHRHLIERGIGRSNLALLSTRLVAGEQTCPPADAVIPVMIPKMDLLPGGKAYLRMPREVLVYPSRSGLLRTNSEKIDHAA
jgi:hypothetical protein